ncbi:MAG: GNAT family protein [Clostridiaceae bacterium]|nr:GNAT family protein [Clostridiaceae bacterium]
MYIQHEGLTLRDAKAGDAPVLAAWWNDGSVMAHAGFPLGIGCSVESVAKSLEQDSDEKGRRLIIEHKVPVGEMSYKNMGDGNACIGIKICEESEQEKGLGRRAMSMLITELFSAMGYGKIVLDTNLTNKRAQHVYELLGFQKIGVNINSWKDQLGELQSSIDYELEPQFFRSFITANNKK